MNLHNLIDRGLLISNLEMLEGLNEPKIKWFIEYVERFPKVDIIRTMERMLEEQSGADMRGETE